MYDLHRMVLAKQIPRIPVIIDSPLATAATAVFEHNADLYDQSEAPVRDIDRLFKYDLLSFTNNTQESKALNERNGPIVIIAGSGMCEGGRILHHLVHGASNPRNTILIVGFQAEHTLGRRIVEKRPTIKVFGEEVELRASVEVLNGYSAHADRTELSTWLAAVRKTSPALKNVYLVHGEPEAQDALAAQLAPTGLKVASPTPGTRVTI
jgi:metallo-beta-lactamase family protein